MAEGGTSLSNCAVSVRHVAGPMPRSLSPPPQSPPAQLPAPAQLKPVTNQQRVGLARPHIKGPTINNLTKWVLLYFGGP